MGTDNTELLKELLLLQRLQLALQCEQIAGPPDEHDKKQARFIAKALDCGHLWALRWEYDGSLEHTIPESVADEVGNILTMWRMLVGGYEALSENDKQDVITQAEPIGGKVKFPGFDGNYESQHLSVTMFLVQDMNRFQELDGRDLNSHWPNLDVYRRMLSVFGAVKGYAGMGKDSIIKVLKSMRHPR